MKVEFFEQRNNCDSIVDHPTITTEVEGSGVQCQSYTAKVKTEQGVVKTYPVELGKWTIGGKTFDAKFYCKEIERDVYGYIGTKPLND